jgi:hypothetical protein
VAGMRELTPSEGFLPLPKVDLLLYKAPGVTSPAVDALHEYLAHYVGQSPPAIGDKQPPLEDTGNEAANEETAKRTGAAA